MSAQRTKAEQRRIRRAIGPAAADAILEVESRAQDTDAFLLMWRHGGFWKRLWSLITGRIS